MGELGAGGRRHFEHQRSNISTSSVGGILELELCPKKRRLRERRRKPPPEPCKPNTAAPPPFLFFSILGWAPCQVTCVLTRSRGAVWRGAVDRGVAVPLLPEESVVDDQDESGHGHAEEVSDGHGHFHPDLSGHVGVFGPQLLSGIARPPLHVQLLHGGVALPAGCFHLGRSAGIFCSAAGSLLIWVRTGTPLRCGEERRITAEQRLCSAAGTAGHRRSLTPASL